MGLTVRRKTAKNLAVRRKNERIERFSMTFTANGKRQK